MKKNEIFEHLQQIEDPVKDHDKILSNLHYSHFFLMDKYKKLLTQYNLTSPQVNVLGIIDYFSPNPSSLEDIKEMVLEPNSDVSRTVTRLVEKGFVEKVTNKENRRKVSIGITPAGKKVLKKIVSDGLFKNFTAKLTLNEAKIFISVLAKLRDVKVP